MKIKQLSTLLAAMPLILSSQLVNATTIGLFEYAFNIDGAVTNGAAPAGVNLASFSTATGLGTISATISGAGNHYFGAFFDHEIDEALNTYFNEFGATSGSAMAGLSWEIDEPGYFFGDIYDNFLVSALDNANGVPPSGLEDDVSMALGWNFSLNAGEQAILSFLLSETMPTGGFYLSQTDHDSSASIYLSTALKIEGNIPGIPEPSILWLLGVGLLGAATHSQFRKRT